MIWRLIMMCFARLHTNSLSKPLTKMLLLLFFVFLSRRCCSTFIKLRGNIKIYIYEAVNVPSSDQINMCSRVKMSLDIAWGEQNCFPLFIPTWLLNTQPCPGTDSCKCHRKWRQQHFKGLSAMAYVEQWVLCQALKGQTPCFNSLLSVFSYVIL